MKAIFIDASVTELKKNFLGIANYFKERDSKFEVLFLTVNTASYVVQSMEEQAEKLISENGYAIDHFTSFNCDKIRKKLKSIAPDYILINAMNTYNELWNAICKEQGVTVYFYSHGFQIDNLFYEKSELLSKIKKVARYTYAIYNISKVIKKPFLGMFKAYANYISRGADLKETALDDPRLYPDWVFVYSEYYKEFWHRKYGIKNVNYEYIMPHDFMLVEPVLAKPQEDAFCYITQTLHEDGRYSKEQFAELLRSLRPVASAVKKFYVKLHPRVESTMYDEAFAGLDNVEIIRDFPHCKVYMTHYSSMAYTSALISGKTIIYELPGQPTHEVYKEVATEIVYDVPQLCDAIVKHMNAPEMPFEDRKHIIEKYASYSGKSPFEVLYSVIYGVTGE